MKQKDIHILNWDKITHDIVGTRITTKSGKNFKRTINKGLLFEDLIEKLISAMFPDEVWRRTYESYDGKKDFVYPAEENLPGKKWAECKNYNSNISLNVIAPTLVMGFIENIECIFFFSYSPLNDNAIEGLLAYSKAINRKIQIFDGNILESLICKYHNINTIAEFFPNTDFAKTYDILKNRKWRIIKIKKDMNGNYLSPRHCFELGESFYIHIIVQNLLHESINYEICLQYNKKNFLKYDTNSEKRSVPFAGVQECSVLCQTLLPGTYNYKIKITTEGIPQILTDKITIIDEPYLFWTGEKALQIYDQCQKHLVNYDNIPLLITSGSGMGKSTLIHILSQEEWLQDKYRILKIDLNLSRNHCAINLFSKLAGVWVNENTPLDQMVETDKAISLLTSSYAESATMIADIIMRFYDGARPFLFIIDDIQKINRPYISLLNELEEKAQKENKLIYYLGALNTDKISLKDFLAYLNWDVNYQNRNYEVATLTEFTSSDILAFFKHKFGLEEIEGYFHEFNKTVRPLEVHNLCSNLKREHIIMQAPNSRLYQIVDPFKFGEHVKQISYFNISVKSICQSLNQGDWPEYILKYLYITNQIYLKAWESSQDCINKLITLGILKEKGGMIEFYHEEIRNSVGKDLDFSEEDYADIYSSDDTDITSKVLCVLNQVGRIRGGSDFLNLFFKMNYEIQTTSQRYEICSLIFKNLELISKEGLTTGAMYFVKSNMDLLNAENGHMMFFQFLKNIADSALRCNCDMDETSAEYMAYFIKKFFDRSLSTYHYQECPKYFIKFEKKFIESTHLSSSRRFFWLAHYANRTAIALDRGSVPMTIEAKEITEMYSRSKDYCQKAGECEELMLQLIVDNFNRSYAYRHNLTADIIKSTYDQLHNIKREALSNLIVLDYHLLLIDYLRFNMTSSETDRNGLEILRNKAAGLRETCRSSFYILKLFIIELYVLIDIKRYGEAQSVLTDAFKFAYKKEMRSYIYKLTYIKAHLLIFRGNPITSPDVSRQIGLALVQLLDTRRNALNDLKREIFLLVQLLQLVEVCDFNYLSECIKAQPSESRELIEKSLKFIKNNQAEGSQLYGMKSYFIFENISFPVV